jgi:uncharacterized membrane protein
MSQILSLLLILVTPLLIKGGEGKLKLINWLSPVVCCYALGILLGNLAPFWSGTTAKTLSEVTVLLALPLLLLSTNLPAWFKLAKKTILSFVLVVFSVMLVSFLAGLAFKDGHPESAKLAGMMVGVYTGGTPNLMAIGKALEVSDEAFVMVNAVDVVLGGLYLLFIMSFGVKLITKFLPASDVKEDAELEIDHKHWQKLGIKQKILHSVALLLVASLSIGLSLLLSRVLSGGESVAIIILGLTSFALGLSFIPKLRHFEGSQEWGGYLLLAFCVAVGSMSRAQELLSGSPWYFIFCGTIMLGSIALHFLFCFLLKIDRDTAIITSMAGIFGPAFAAPMCEVLKNRSLLVSGVTTGLVGYAIGNFAGIFLAHLLK